MGRGCGHTHAPQAREPTTASRRRPPGTQTSARKASEPPATCLGPRSWALSIRLGSSRHGQDIPES